MNRNAAAQHALPRRAGARSGHRRGTAVALAAMLLAWGASAWSSAPAEPGPEDVPPDNRFDTAQMESTLVVARTDVHRFAVAAVDAHSHSMYAASPEAVTQWVALQARVGVERTFVFTGASGAAFRHEVGLYAGAYPARFVMFAGILTDGAGAPDYAERLRVRLREDVAAGARGLGELTDKGLGLLQVDGLPVYIDDERFDALWDEAGRLGLPVFVHIAEPAAFYRAADARNELRRAANWSLADKGTPGFEAMLQKFERVLDRHRGTRFVAVHSFNLANDLGRVEQLLARHPNVQVDFAARMWELARQPFTARRFFLRHADRILFGTDNDPTEAMYLAHVRQLETDDEWFWPADAEWWRGYGLQLPPAVLRRIYRDNALKLLGRVPRAAT